VEALVGLASPNKAPIPQTEIWSLHISRVLSNFQCQTPCTIIKPPHWKLSGDVLLENILSNFKRKKVVTILSLKYWRNICKMLKKICQKFWCLHFVGFFPFFRMVHSKNRYWQRFRLKMEKSRFASFEKKHLFAQKLYTQKQWLVAFLIFVVLARNSSQKDRIENAKR